MFPNLSGLLQKEERGWRTWQNLNFKGKHVHSRELNDNFLIINRFYSKIYETYRIERNISIKHISVIQFS